MKRLFILLIILLSLNLIYSNEDESSFYLNREDNNFFFYVSNTSSVSVNNKFNLLYKRPSDLWYPRNDSIIQSYYTFPVNRNLGLGPSLFSQNIIYLSNDGNNDIVNFDSIILAGMSFVFTPFIPKINKPALFFFIDIGPAVVINNNKVHNENLNAMIGGYSSQLIILPIVPIHLFVMDMNVLSVVRTETAAGIMPGVRLRNQFLARFSFLNFIDKSIRSGIKIKNIYSFILTGKPSDNDLANQFTYDKLFISFFWNGLKGFEIENGYGFEYYTPARKSDFYTAHKFFTEMSFNKNGFTIGVKHSLNFWCDKIKSGTPINEFEVSLGYRIERF